MALNDRISQSVTLIVGNPKIFNDVMPIFRSHETGFPEQVRNLTSESRSSFTMSKIGHLQNCLEEIFDEFTPKFVNKLYWIQLQYRVEKNEDFSGC